MKIFAVMSGDVVENVIVEPADWKSLSDDIVDITDMRPRPGIGWSKTEDGYAPPALQESETGVVE